MNSNPFSEILTDVFEILPKIYSFHSPYHWLYIFLKNKTREEISKIFNDFGSITFSFNPIGKISIEHINMGAVDTTNLFDIDELVMFSFYWINRNRYSRVLDLGANIGLHSIMLHKCNFDVTAYEPDPFHYEILQKNFSMNDISNIIAHRVGVSDKTGISQFVRVLGNTMSSHIIGSKSNPYGKLEYFDIETISFRELIGKYDLIKMDIEGQEKNVLLTSTQSDWNNCDALIEVQCEENAISIFNYFSKIRVNLFSQMNGWRKVQSIENMPKSYKDGTLFISIKNEMPWG